MMEKEYYIVVNNNRVGPLSFDGLREHGLEPSTLVWTAGMADWARADSLPELETLLASANEGESAFGFYVRPEQSPHVRPWQQHNHTDQRYGSCSNANENGQIEVKTNWKILAIVATVAGFIFSCIGGIVGIFALLEANKAENAAITGNDQMASNRWSNCKTLTIISFVLIGLGLLTNVAILTKGVNLLSFYY